MGKGFLYRCSLQFQEGHQWPHSISQACSPHERTIYFADEFQGLKRDMFFERTKDHFNDTILNWFVRENKWHHGLFPMNNSKRCSRTFNLTSCFLSPFITSAKRSVEQDTVVVGLLLVSPDLKCKVSLFSTCEIFLLSAGLAQKAVILLLMDFKTLDL